MHLPTYNFEAKLTFVANTFNPIKYDSVDEIKRPFALKTGGSMNSGRHFTRQFFTFISIPTILTKKQYLVKYSTKGTLVL